RHGTPPEGGGDQGACLTLRGQRHDGAAERFAHLAIDILRRDPGLAVRGGAAEERLRGLLVEHARVDGAVVQLAEREERGQRDAAVAAASRWPRSSRSAS